MFNSCKNLLLITLLVNLGLSSHFCFSAATDSVEQSTDYVDNFDEDDDLDEVESFGEVKDGGAESKSDKVSAKKTKDQKNKRLFIITGLGIAGACVAGTGVLFAGKHFLGKKSTGGSTPHHTNPGYPLPQVHHTNPGGNPILPLGTGTNPGATVSEEEHSLTELPQPSPTAIRGMFPQIQGMLAHTPAPAGKEHDVIFRTRQLAKIEEILHSGQSYSQKLSMFYSNSLSSPLHLKEDVEVMQARGERYVKFIVEEVAGDLEKIAKGYEYFKAQGIITLFAHSGSGCVDATLGYLEDQYIIAKYPNIALFKPNLSISDSESSRFAKLFQAYTNLAARKLLPSGVPVTVKAIQDLNDADYLRKYVSIKNFIEWGINNSYISHTKSNFFVEQFTPMVIKGGSPDYFRVKDAVLQAIQCFPGFEYEVDAVLVGKDLKYSSDLDITTLLGIDVTEH